MIKQSPTPQFLNSNSGQVVLILVLLTIVAVTIGLSVVARTVTDIRMSSQIEQSNRAFSAAEAGIENALRYSSEGTFTGNITVGGTNANYSYEVQKVGGATSPRVDLGVVNPNESRTVWLAEHDDAGILRESAYFNLNQPINICWNNSSSGGQPAMLVTLYYKDGSSYYFLKNAYDPNNGRGNNFDLAGTAGGYCSAGYRYGVTIQPNTNAANPFRVQSIGSILLFVKVQPIYFSTSIAIRSGGASPLPFQGKQITSVGQTQTGVVRRIQVVQGFTALPSLLDFALFSE